MYNKLFNPDSKDFKFRFLDTVLVVPSKSSIVVSSSVAETVLTHYATIEVSEATEEEYKAYRAEKEAKELEAKKLAEEAKELEAKKLAEEEALKQVKPKKEKVKKNIK